MNLPFNPAETSPWDLYRAAKARVFEHALVLGAVAIVAIIALAWVQPDLSGLSLPSWARVFIATAVIVALVAYTPARDFVSWIHNRETRTLIELEPIEGDFRVHELAPDRFAELRVVDERDIERSTNYLSVLETGDGRAHECKQYDPETNTATSSWLAGKSYKDIRAEEKTLEYIENELAAENDQYLDLRVNHNHVVRQAIRKVSIRVIEQIEEATVPHGELIHETINDVIEDHSVLDDLDRSDDESEADQEAGGTPAATNGAARTDGGEQADER